MSKVMIIEDNKDIQEIYKHSFEKAGWEVLLEDDGFSGVNDVVDKNPDIILLDLMMPKMDGFQFLRTLRSNPLLKMPVVVCSNISDNEVNARVLEAGAAAVILKVDYSGKQLVEKVTHILESSKNN